MIHIYTDGSCKSNGNSEAYGSTGVVMLDGDTVIHTHNQTYKGTTNNRMEYRAMIYAMRWCIQKEIGNPHILSDSKLLLNTITQWMSGWQKKDWKKGGSGEASKIKNLDLVLELWELRQQLPSATFEWVKGHSDHKYNDMADELTNDLHFDEALDDATNNEILITYSALGKIGSR
jgi:ribonuclease HI